MELEQAAQAVARWAEEGERTSPPSWQDLPSIPLYMDQVILYLGENLKLFQRDEDSSLLTSSMINNYVKTGLIPHPDKKKYTKEHLAGLMAICMLKQVLSIQDMKTLFSQSDMTDETYELFRETHIAAVKETCAALEETCRTGADLKRAALLLAAESNAKRAAAERILCELGREELKDGKKAKEAKGAKS